MDFAKASLPLSRSWSRPMVRARGLWLTLAGKLGRWADWAWRDGRVRVISLIAPVVLVLATPVAPWQAALGYVALGVFLWALFRAQMRVVIEGFDDYTTPPGQPTEASGSDAQRDGKGRTPKDSGAAVLLANRLAELRELYGFVDDPDRTPAPGRAAGATVQLDDASKVLRSAVTTESTVSVGPITVPWGALMGVVARFSQAPQLQGAIHGDEQALILTSELNRYRQPHSWRVEADVQSGTSPRKQVESMILDDLAFRIFSDLTLQRQARWPATKFWLLALEKMAECQRRPRNRRLLLKEAERNFVKALAEDERFYLACLNLGIVYRRLALELERVPEHATRAERDTDEQRARRYRGAARRVFERAIDLRPDRWEAYHALADVHWAPKDKSGSLEMIPGLCDRALDRKPDRAARARILDLKAHAERRAAEVAADDRDDLEAERLLLAAVETHREACVCALKELRRASLWRFDPTEVRRLETLEKQASQCLVNLAETAWDARKLCEHRAKTDAERDAAAFKWAFAVAELAAELSDLDAYAHAVLAKMAREAGALGIAVDELSAAARIAPANALYAARLATARARTGEPRALDACTHAEQLIDFGLQDDAEAADELRDAYRALGTRDGRERAEEIVRRTRLPYKLDRALAEEDQVAALTALLPAADAKPSWSTARIQEALGRALVESEDQEHGTPEERGKAADEQLKAALGWFLDEQPGHRRVAELHAERAAALALVPPCSGDALAEAETAVTLDPLCARYRDVLARAYEAGRDLDSAVSAAEDAVLLEPDVPRRHYRKAKLRWELAESLADPALHDAQRRLASGEFEQALTLYESDQQDERRTTCWWLAMSYFAMSEFDRVPPHLRFVLGSLTRDSGASPEEQLVTAAAEMWLAMTYRKLRDFHSAEDHARAAIAAAEALDDGTPARLAMVFPAEMDDARWPLGLVLALAHVEFAGSRADRGGDLEAARTSLGAAKAVTARMRVGGGLTEAVREAESGYEAARGRVLLANGETVDAIGALRKAADLDPGEADVYLLLARAHAGAAEQRVEQSWQEHLRDARNACRRTREIGGDGHPDTLAADELERDLKRIEVAELGQREFVAPVGDGAAAPAAGEAHAGPSTQAPDVIGLFARAFKATGLTRDRRARDDRRRPRTPERERGRFSWPRRSAGAPGHRG